MYRRSSGPPGIQSLRMLRFLQHRTIAAMPRNLYLSYSVPFPRLELLFHVQAFKSVPLKAFSQNVNPPCLFLVAAAFVLADRRKRKPACIRIFS